MPRKSGCLRIGSTSTPTRSTTLNLLFNIPYIIHSTLVILPLRVLYGMQNSFKTLQSFWEKLTQFYRFVIKKGEKRYIADLSQAKKLMPLIKDLRHNININTNYTTHHNHGLMEHYICIIFREQIFQDSSSNQISPSSEKYTLLVGPPQLVRLTLGFQI